MTNERNGANYNTETGSGKANNGIRAGKWIKWKLETGKKVMKYAAAYFIQIK